jgi:hypothetical protein
MKKVKSFILMIVVLTIGLFAFSGCEQAITPAQIQALANKQQVFQQKADEAQAMSQGSPARRKKGKICQK